MNSQVPLKRDFALIYMLVYGIVLFILPLIYYSNQSFGFKDKGYGIGIFFTILFPMLWIGVYVYCDNRIKRNKKIDSNKIQSISQEGKQ
jgi:hypothetical protein